MNSTEVSLAEITCIRITCLGACVAMCIYIYIYVCVYIYRHVYVIYITIIKRHPPPFPLYKPVWLRGGIIAENVSGNQTFKICFLLGWELTPP